MMNVEEGKCYKVEIKRRGRSLDYVFRVVSIIGGEAKVITDDGERLHFYLKEIVRAKEVPCFNEEKTWVIRTKGVKKEELKKVVEPDF